MNPTRCRYYTRSYGEYRRVGVGVRVASADSAACRWQSLLEQESLNSRIGIDAIYLPKSRSSRSLDARSISRHLFPIDLSDNRPID